MDIGLTLNRIEPGAEEDREGDKMPADTSGKSLAESVDFV